MHGRIAVGAFAFALSVLSSGCVTTTAQQKNVVSPPIDETPRVAKKDDGVKKTPKASTEIAFAKFKETEADTEAAKANPEGQSRLRDDARRAYQQALKSDPNNLDAMRGLAGLYTKAGEMDRAFDLYKQAMTKNPRDAKLWYDLGCFHHRRKDFQESLRCFQKCLEIEPENRDCLKKLGFTYAWMGQIEQGLHYLARAQGAAMAHYNVARIMLQRDQHGLARQHLHAALRENSQLAEARELLQQLESQQTVRN